MRQQYEATLNSARQNFQGVMTAQASLSGIRVQSAMARKSVEDTLIRAPFAGYVSARPVAAGQYVALTSKIATVLRITPIKLELQVPESNAPQMRVGAHVEATVPGYPERIFQGMATAVNPAVDQNSRTFTVVAEFPNTDIALKPGMFATARILLPGSSNGIFVPKRAIITDPTTNSSQLFFIRDGRARLAVVQLGAADGDLVQILSGISAGATIATDHLQDLYDGQPVQIAQR
jgi:RND family efflux transporter MFP subunit